MGDRDPPHSDRNQPNAIEWLEFIKQEIEAARSDGRAEANAQEKGWIHDLFSAKVIMPVLISGTVALVSGVIGLITVGERISLISQRSENAISGVAVNRSLIDAMVPRVWTLENQSSAALRERSIIVAQLTQNRDGLASQLEDLRKDREASNVKLGRIEGQLEDLRAAVSRLESKRGQSPVPWRDAQTPSDRSVAPPPPP